MKAHNLGYSPGALMERPYTYYVLLYTRLVKAQFGWMKTQPEEEFFRLEIVV